MNKGEHLPPAFDGEVVYVKVEDVKARIIVIGEGV